MDADCDSGWRCLLFCFRSNHTKTADGSTTSFPPTWKTILDRKVLFYHNLPPEDKIRFEKDVSRFIKNVKITGVNTEVDITDKLLVASSAAIPVFGFPDWNYTFLDEVSPGVVFAY